jgi:hypothetical protein
MTQTRLRAVVAVLILLLSTLSCARFGSSEIAKPTKVVDFPSMVGKSLQELTEMLGPATPRVLCYGWELPEGELRICYEIGDHAKKLMSSLSYELKPDARSELDRGFRSPQEMMALININVEGKEPEENRRGFFTYDIRMNGRSCFVDVRPRSRQLFRSWDPVFVEASLHIRNPSITLYTLADNQGNGKTYHEQQTNLDLSVGSVTLGSGDWEVCTGVNFTGECKILDGIDREYLENSRDFSRFGLGEKIRSFRPIEIRRDSRDADNTNRGGVE